MRLDRDYDGTLLGSYLEEGKENCFYREFIFKHPSGPLQAALSVSHFSSGLPAYKFLIFIRFCIAAFLVFENAILSNKIGSELYFQCNSKFICEYVLTQLLSEPLGSPGFYLPHPKNRSIAPDKKSK